MTHDNISGSTKSWRQSGYIVPDIHTLVDMDNNSLVYDEYRPIDFKLLEVKEQSVSAHILKERKP